MRSQSQGDSPFAKVIELQVHFAEKDEGAADQRDFVLVNTIGACAVSVL